MSPASPADLSVGAARPLLQCLFMSMQQKRARSPRLRKRLAVRFGRPSSGFSLGFTTNLSASGLGLVTSTPHPQGTRLALEVQLSATETCRVEGVVAWARRGMAELRAPGSMGIEINAADESYRAYVAQLEPVIRKATG